MEQILEYGEKQLVLYTKGHFVKTNLLEDLKKICSVRFEIPEKSVEFYIVYNAVTDIFLKLHKSNHIEEGLEDFFKSLFKWSPVLTPEDFLEKMLSPVSMVKAKGLELGSADPQYLEIKHA